MTHRTDGMWGREIRAREKAERETVSNDKVKQEADRRKVLKVINAQVLASHRLNSDPGNFVINQNSLAEAFTDLLATVRQEEREAAFKEAIAAVPQVGVTFPNGYEEWVDAPFYREMVIAALERVALEASRGKGDLNG